MFLPNRTVESSQSVEVKRVFDSCHSLAFCVHACFCVCFCICVCVCVCVCVIVSSIHARRGICSGPGGDGEVAAT